MVVLDISKENQRANQVKLTKKSLDYFETRESEGNQLLEKIFFSVSRDETRKLCNLLMKVVRSTEIAIKEGE